MNNNTNISFGDNVRVKDEKLTNELGVTGLIGNVRGETTPSVTNVVVIGELVDDFAFNVFFDELKKDYWFAPQLLEFVDHASGTEIMLKGVPKKWTRNEAGEWIESNIKDKKRKPWWKFW
jgi:hypothetical protein